MMMKFTILIHMNQAFITEMCVLYPYEVYFQFIRVNVIFAAIKKSRSTYM